MSKDGSTSAVNRDSCEPISYEVSSPLVQGGEEGSGDKPIFVSSGSTGKCLQAEKLKYIAARYSEIRYTAIVPDSWLTSQAFHVLIALAARDQHGYGIMQDVASRTQGKIRLGAGTLYGLIKRLLEDGLIVEVRESRRAPQYGDDGRRRYYRLTPKGRRTAQAEVARILQMSDFFKTQGILRYYLSIDDSKGMAR